MAKKAGEEKRVFLSATYEDLVDLVEEIKNKLASEGIKVLHFREGRFYGGSTKVHPHDLCLQNVDNTSNYLLIVNTNAGNDYKGNNLDYHGLTVTHAEFKAALAANEQNPKRSSFFFVRERVWESYRIWKSLSDAQRKGGDWPAEYKVYALLEDMVNNNVYVYTFNDSRRLKELINDMLSSFVTEVTETADEMLNVDTLSAYLHNSYPDRPPTPPDHLVIVTVELGRYGCQTISELDAKLKTTEKAFSELEKTFRENGEKSIHGGGVIRNSLWILDDNYYEKRIVGFTLEKEIDRKQFRHLI